MVLVVLSPFPFPAFLQDHCSLEKLPAGPARGASHQLWAGGHGPEVNHWPDLQWLHFSVWVWHLHTALPGENWAMGITGSVSVIWVILFFYPSQYFTHIIYTVYNMYFYTLFILYGICLSCPPSLKEEYLRLHIAVKMGDISGCRIKKIPKYTLQLPGTFSILPWIRFSLSKVTLRLKLWHSSCKPGNVKLRLSLCLPSSLSLLSDLFSMEGELFRMELKHGNLGFLSFELAQAGCCEHVCVWEKSLYHCRDINSR